MEDDVVRVVRTSHWRQEETLEQRLMEVTE
jgi:hypothetical protein